eukprot:4206868-Pleurochrysis_carterae.AAC.1
MCKRGCKKATKVMRGRLPDSPFLTCRVTVGNFRNPPHALWIRKPVSRQAWGLCTQSQRPK